MTAPNNRNSQKGLRRYWTSPPRTGMRLIIAPWEYRNLRAWARVHIFGGIVLLGLALVTLGAGGNDLKTYGWAMVFLAPAVAKFAFAYWELTIARSRSQAAVR